MHVSARPVKEFLVRNKSILLLLGLWYVVGSLSPIAFIPLGILSIILLWRRQLFFEILLGYFFILILSDNLRPATDFAKSFKNIYTLFIAAIAIFERRKIEGISEIFKPYLPFIAIATVGLVFSPVVFTGAQKTLSYILLIFSVPQLLLISFRTEGDRIFKDLIFLGIALILVGFLLRYVDPGVAMSHGGRFRAVLGNPNGLGVFTSLLFALFLLVRSYFPRLLSKSDLRWILATLVIATLLSGSRTAIISISLLYFFSFSFRISPIIGVVLFISIGIGAEIVSANFVSIIQSMGLSDYLRAETIDDGAGRYIAWQFAWDAIQENYWFGRGFSFDEWLMSTNQDLLNDLGHQGGVHNTYLIIWLNTGLVGLVLFLRAILLNFIRGAKNNRLAFPILFMVLFGITLEPWLAASLNPYTIIFVVMLCLLNEPVFQSESSAERVDQLIDMDAKALA